MATGRQRATAKEKHSNSKAARKIKYMGSSHVRVIPKGDKIGGELVDGVPSAMRWDIADHHIAEVPSDWSETMVEALLDYSDGDEFEDVTGQERVKPSLGQKIWHGAKGRIDPEEDFPEQDSTLGEDGVETGASMEGGQTGTADPALST